MGVQSIGSALPTLAGTCGHIPGDETAPCNVYDDGEFGIRYELFAVVEHTGKLHSGHYTAFVKVGVVRCKQMHHLALDSECRVAVLHKF